VVCEPVFLEATENPVVNVRSLLEYTAYAVATKKLQAQTVESHLSAIQRFRAIARCRGIATESAKAGVVAHAARRRAFGADVGGWWARFVACSGGVIFLFNAGGRDVCRNEYAHA